MPRPTLRTGWAFVGLVGPVRFELTTFRPPDGRANQAAPRPDAAVYRLITGVGASVKTHLRAGSSASVGGAVAKAKPPVVKFGQTLVNRA